MLLGALAFGSAMALMAGALTVVYVHAHPRCSDQALAQAHSPDGQWTATLMERRCGEETPFFLHVNLRPREEALRWGFFSGRADEGEVFLAEEDTQGTKVALEWTTSDRLTIRCAKCKRAALRRDVRWGPVTITYEIGQQ